MSRRLVIASHNAKKAQEMVTILSAGLPNWTIQTLADYPPAPDPEETGTTFTENAAIKALAAFQTTGGEWVIADDGGLCVDALDGAPGMYSKRFAGEETPFPEKMARLLEMLRDVPPEQRGCHFHCTVALMGPNLAEPRFFQGDCFGRIAEAPSGNHGFGYDPIVIVNAVGKAMAELTPEEKHRVSHRGQALRDAILWLQSLPE